MGDSGENENVAAGENATELFNELRDIYGSESLLAIDAVLVNGETPRKVLVDAADGWSSVAAAGPRTDRSTIVPTVESRRRLTLASDENTQKPRAVKNGSSRLKRKHSRTTSASSTRHTKSVRIGDY